MATFTEDFDDSTDIDEHLGSEIVSNELRPEDLDEGTCLTLDGTADYGHTADAAEWTFNTGGTDDPFSVSLWVKTTWDGSTFEIMFGKVDGSPFTASEYEFRFTNANKIQFYCIKSDFTAYVGRQTGDILSQAEDKWAHICGTYSGSETYAGFAIYVNGVRADTTDLSSGSYTGMSDGGQNPTIGCRAHADTPLYFLGGEIKDVRVHSVELTAEEVWKLYSVGVDDQSANLVGHWKVNEGSGTTVDNDEGTASRDLTLVSTPPWSTTHPSFFARRTRTTSGNLL